MPPIPLSTRSSLESIDLANTDNPYDEIPGGGVAVGGANHTHLQPNNLYAEINPRPPPPAAARLSGGGEGGARARGNASRPNCECHVVASLKADTSFAQNME